MANSNKAKKRICDVIDYKKDIEPYPFVKIYSGVNSGKSYFAAKMMTGSVDPYIPRQNVLLITSRRSKVEETLKEMGAEVKRKITINGNLSEEVWNTGEERPFEYEKNCKEVKIHTDYGVQTVLTYNQSVVCTNAFVSAYMRNTYNPDNPLTHIWNKFDTIIIDEIHSLVTDATYQSATFDVFDLIREYLKLNQNNQLQECACKHLILMSGTPQPFDYLVDIDFSEELTNTKVLFDECRNVVPENVILIDKQTAEIRIQELLSKGKKLIYFSNRTLTESEVKSKFKLSDKINIGISFSSKEKIKTLPKEEKDKIEKLNDSLATNSLIPDDIQFFVTTSRNKEGININNTDYDNMFVETHLMYDAVQMVGRIRSGVTNLYIITDAKQFINYSNLTDILFTKKVMIKNSDVKNSLDIANAYLTTEYLTKDSELQKPYDDRRQDIMNYVKYIEDRFGYIKYSIFNQEFEYFHTKEKAEKMTIEQNNAFDKMLLSEGNDFVEQWFPKSCVKRELSAKTFCDKYLKSIIGKDDYVVLSEEEMKKHLSLVRKRFNSDLRQIKTILNLVDEKYNFIKRTNDYILYYGEDPRKKTRSRPMKRRKKH